MELILIPVVLFGSLMGVLLGIAMERDTRKRYFLVVSRTKEETIVRCRLDPGSGKGEELLHAFPIDLDTPEIKILHNKEHTP